MDNNRGQVRSCVSPVLPKLLLDRQLAAQAATFEKEADFSERLYRCEERLARSFHTHIT